MAFADRSFASIDQAQAELDAWVGDYKTTRPHQALEMAIPAERFRLEPLARDGSSIPVEEHEELRGQSVLRRVASNGIISVDNQMFSVGNAYKAELVDVLVDDAVIQVWSKNHLIKTKRGNGPVLFARSEPMGFTSSVSRTRSVKRQAELDRGHSDQRNTAVLCRG